MADETEDVPVPWTYSDRFKLIVIVAKVSGMLSIVASCFIIRHILDKKHRAQNLAMMRNRILLIFSFGDIVHSFCHFLGTWGVQKDYAWGAYGNDLTCSIQAGITHFAAELTILLNCSLSVCYVLVVCFAWKEDELRRPLPSFCLLGIPFLFSFGIVLWCFIDQAYNYNAGWFCWINEYPTGCSSDPDVECERGKHANIIEIVNTPVGSWVPTIIVFISCIMLWWAVRRKETESQRFSFNGEQTRTLSNRIAMQGIYYSGVFFITYMFYYIFMMVKVIGDGTFPPWLLVAHVFVGPFQGVLNAFVYFRPMFWARWRRRQEQKEKQKMKEERESKRQFKLDDDRSKQDSMGVSTHRTYDSSKLVDSSRDHFGDEPSKLEKEADQEKAQPKTGLKAFFNDLKQETLTETNDSGGSDGDKQEASTETNDARGSNE